MDLEQKFHDAEIFGGTTDTQTCDNGTQHYNDTIFSSSLLEEDTQKSCLIWC